MAYPFEEDFVSGIPSGFASNGGGGGITATWEEAEQAARLVFNNAQNFGGHGCTSVHRLLG